MLKFQSLINLIEGILINLETFYQCIANSIAKVMKMKI